LFWAVFSAQTNKANIYENISAERNSKDSGQKI